MPAWYSGLYMSVLEQLCLWMCVFCLQELQGVEAVENPLGQVGDLISIQHAGKPQSRQECHTPSDVYTQTHTRRLSSEATHRELRERSPWKASGAISEIWLLLRSLLEKENWSAGRRRQAQSHSGWPPRQDEAKNAEP